MDPFSLGMGLSDTLSRGRVISVNVNSFTANVYLTEGVRRGMEVESPIRSVSKNDATRSGVLFVPDVGDEVYVDWRYGPQGMITEHVPFLLSNENPSDYKTNLLPNRTFGGEDDLLNGDGRRPYRWGPTDVMPGDKFIMGQTGNMVGVLNGGVTVMKASGLAQTIMTPANGTVTTVARNWQVFSDFGVARMFSREGVTGFEILGNNNALRSNKHQDVWDFRFQLGGDRQLLDMRLGKDKFQHQVNPDGKSTLSAQGGALHLYGNTLTTKVTGSQFNTITLNERTRVDNNSELVVSGIRKETVSRYVTLCTGSSNSVVSGAESSSYLSTRSETIQGTSAISVNPAAKSTTVAAGNYELSIGNPIYVGVPAPSLLVQGKTGEYKLEVFNGNIENTILVKGDIVHRTTLGAVTFTTGTGNAGMSILGAGNLTLSTSVGNATLSTVTGNVEATTQLGNATFGATTGNATLQALTGTSTVVGGTSKIEAGPAGSKWTNGVEELGQILTDLTTALQAATAPGFNAPLSSAPALALILTRLTAWRGV